MDSIEQKSAARKEALRKDDAVEQENDVPQARELLDGKIVSPKPENPIAALEKEEDRYFNPWHPEWDIRTDKLDRHVTEAMLKLNEEHEKQPEMKKAEELGFGSHHT